MGDVRYPEEAILGVEHSGDELCQIFLPGQQCSEVTGKVGNRLPDRIRFMIRISVTVHSPQVGLRVPGSRRLVGGVPVMDGSKNGKGCGRGVP